MSPVVPHRDRFFGTLNFSSQNEGWETEARALELRPHDTVLCVTGSGDRPLNLLASSPASRVVAIDLAPMQNHLLRLKVAAVRGLDYDRYLQFLGQHEVPKEARWAMFEELELPADSVEVWTARRSDVEAGVLYRGRFERYFATIAAMASRLRPGVVERLFEFDDLEDQREFVGSVWDKPLWRWTFRLLLHPSTSRAFYGDPAYFAHVGVNVGDYVYDRILEYLSGHLARDSFMLSLIFRGRLDDRNLPPYLTSEGHAVLRERLDGLEIVTGDIVDHMREQGVGTYSRFSLSDVPSYLDAHHFQRLLNGVRACATDDARIVIRQFLTTYELPGHQQGVFVRRPELEAELAAQDQALAYRFIVTDLDPEPSGSGDGVLIRPYRLEDNAAALALERQCIQGESYRLSFRRSAFHRRAENFSDYFIAVAEIDGEIVGTSAAALKDALVFGEPRRVAFFFDTRVRPDMRGEGIAKRLGVDVFGWAFRQVGFGYLFTVADNRIVRFLMELGAGEEVGGYKYLVFPTFAPRQPATPANPSTLDDVHESMLATDGPFDFYSDPRGGDAEPHRGSWLVQDGEDRAGCSAWDNREILAEVVERIPWQLALIGWLARTFAWLGARLPHIPTPGETLRSWYIFDFHATRPDLARDLVRRVAAEAAGAGIDYCYIPFQPGAEWVEAVRADVPKAFAPLIPYTLIAGWTRPGRLPPMDHIYVDIRDL